MEEKTKKGGKKNVLLAITAVIILLGVSCWFIYYTVSSAYFKTDNAKVSATLHTVSAGMPGKLVKLLKGEGDTVEANEIIGRIEGGTYIKSPVDGEIMSCDVKLGQAVGTGQPIAVIADTDDVCVQANIEETDIVKIHEGAEVIVSLDAYSGRKIHGHVDSIDKVTQAALTGMATSFTTSGTYTKVTQLIPVKIVLDENVGLDSIIGTNATVKIRVK